AGDAAASGVAGRVRVAAAVSGADARPGPGGTRPAAVVDAAAPVPAAVLPCGAAHVHAGRGVAREGLDAARPAAYRRLPEGRGPAEAAGGHPVDPGLGPAGHAPGLPAPGAR